MVVANVLHCPKNEPNGRHISKEQQQQALNIATIEMESKCLSNYVQSWISRKVLFGQMESFAIDVDFKIHLFQHQFATAQISTSYTFVCLRCNTTIKAFKRPNGSNWNTANICRHLVDCHSNVAASRYCKKRKLKETSDHQLAPVRSTSTKSRHEAN